MTPKTKFWSVDVPGQDPVVLPWAWWVSLALSRFLNFASFPVRIPVQSSVLSANDTIMSLIVPVMAGDCGDEIPSKSKPQPAGVMSCVNPANLLSFCCTVHRLFGFQFWSSNCKFSLVFREFHECSTNSSAPKHFSSIFPVSIPELLFQFLAKLSCSIHFPRISKRFSTFAYVTLHLLMFRRATTCLCQS